MTRNLEGRLSRADIGWLAAAIFVLFIGMTFVLFFDQTVVAWADNANVDVGIANFAFTPAALTVKAGETVTFENHDSTVHSLVGVGGFFRSKPLEPMTSSASRSTSPANILTFSAFTRI